MSVFDRSRRPETATLIALFFILAGAILRLTLRQSTSLWEDEIIAATHAVQPLWRLLVNTIINDMHPPLYFIELHVWSSISRADGWLIANSVLFSLAALASIHTVMRRLHGGTDALLVTAVFATLPVCLWMAEEVRMYALLSVLLIWLYYFTYRAFARAPSPQRRPYLAVALIALAIVYTHAIGFIAVLFYGLFAASWLLTRKAARREWLSWLMVFGGTGVLTLPILASDLLRPADMPPLQGAADILGWLASVVVGGGYRLIPALQIAGGLAFLAITVAGLYSPRTRRLTLCFLIGPMVLCIVIALVMRPLFKTDFFANFYSPFLAIVIGQLLAGLPVRRGLRAGMALLVLASLLGLGIVNRHALNKVEGYYRAATTVITAGYQPGDVVFAPQGDIFWGLCWYLVGPDWGSPVSTIAPLRAGSGWYRVFDRLGPAWVERLDLLPKAQSVMRPDGMRILTSMASEAAAEQAPRVWLVTYAPRNDVPAAMPGDHLGPLTRATTYDFAPVQVNLYKRN